MFTFQKIATAKSWLVSDKTFHIRLIFHLLLFCTTEGHTENSVDWRAVDIYSSFRL